jgi:hypothetical protein
MHGPTETADDFFVTRICFQTQALFVECLQELAGALEE